MIEVVALGIAVLGLMFWAAQLITVIRVTRSVPKLHQLPVEEREVWPRLSVILTACNEEARLEAAVKARLENDYPNLELILGAGLLATALATMLISNRWLKRSSGNLVLWPVAELLVCYSQLRSGVLGTVRGGIVWRGTFYPNSVLKPGRRFGQVWDQKKNDV